MNISEASATNTVLRRLLGEPGPTGRVPDDDELREACRLLARNAHRALMAGLDVQHVDTAFDEGRVARRPRRRTPAR